MDMRRHPTLGALAALAALATGAPAQDLQWRLPDRGAAEYARTWRASSAVARTAGLARTAATMPGAPDRYVQRLAPAPWLCQRELRPDQRAIADPAFDVRDLVRRCAFDLSARGSARWDALVAPYGDVVVSDTFGETAVDGAQTLRARVACRPPAAPAGADRDAAERLRAGFVRGATGTLTIARTVDRSSGLVRSFAGELDLVVDEGEGRFRRLVLQDRWDLIAIRENQDADFRGRVAAAIRAGAGFVRAAIDADRSFLRDAGDDDRSYGSGRLALALLTLVHAQVPPDDPAVERGLHELRRRKLVDSYSLATALMAIAAASAPPGEAERIRAGQLAGVQPRTIDARDRKVGDRWLGRLLRNVDPRTDPAEVLRFNYIAGPRYDTSLQQYGLLGLWSAKCCGLGAEGTAFAAAARQLLAVQAPAAARAVELELTTHAFLREQAGVERPPRPPTVRATPRGFAYRDPDEAPYGSMTAAGLGGLLLASAGMAACGHVDRALAARIDDAVRDAFAWLASEFTVRANPGVAGRTDDHWYYWLYCLERCCELAGVAHLDGRDWYHEGALQLMAQQQADGSFRAEHASGLLLDATCFAVLFLAKATAPAAITGG
jgi:hypothetical protein